MKILSIDREFIGDALCCIMEYQTNKDKFHYGLFDVYMSDNTICQIKSYCAMMGWEVSIDKCHHGTYDIMISWE